MTKLKKLEKFEIADALKQTRPFVEVASEDLHRLLDQCSETRLRPSDRLFETGDAAEYCYVVVSGSIRLARPLANGKESIMRFCQPGDFIGAAILVNPQPVYPVTAVTSEETRLVRIPRAHYLSVWQTQPQVACAVGLHVMNRLLEFQEDKAMSVAPVPQRIAKFLLRVQGLKLTRRDIAERVGTSVETVIRTLSEWTGNGWLATKSQHIDILDRAALQAIVDRE